MSGLSEQELDLIKLMESKFGKTPTWEELGGAEDLAMTGGYPEPTGDDGGYTPADFVTLADINNVQDAQLRRADAERGVAAYNKGKPSPFWSKQAIQDTLTLLSPEAPATQKDIDALDAQTPSNDVGTILDVDFPHHDTGASAEMAEKDVARAKAMGIKQMSDVLNDKEKAAFTAYASDMPASAKTEIIAALRDASRY